MKKLKATEFRCARCDKVSTQDNGFLRRRHGVQKWHCHACYITLERFVLFCIEIFSEWKESRKLSND